MLPSWQPGEIKTCFSIQNYEVYIYENLNGVETCELDEANTYNFMTHLKGDSREWSHYNYNIYNIIIYEIYKQYIYIYIQYIYMKSITSVITNV